MRPWTPQLTAVAESTYAQFHAIDPPVGLVDHTTFPAPSPATHSDTDGHEIAVRLVLPGSTLVRDQADAPAVGLVDVTTLPARSTTAQSDDDGHDTPVSTDGLLPSALLLSICATVHDGAPRAGSDPTRSAHCQRYPPRHIAT